MPENPASAETVTPANGPEVTPVTAPVVEADPAGAEALGDPGKKALDTMKAERNAEREKRRELEARLAALESSATKTSDADRKLNARIVRAEIKAAAAGKLADPTDALALLDLSGFEVSEDGDVDAQKVSAAIEDLLTRKPHLAATAKQRFQGSGDGGAQRKASGPDQLTRADLKGKSPEFIAKAKADGRLNDVLGIK